LTRGGTIVNLLFMVRFSLVVALVLGWVLGSTGCKTRSKPPEPISEGVKLADLAAPPKDRPPPPQFLVTASIDVHIVELPADNVDKLQTVWRILSAAPVRLSSYNAFSENSFRILFGKIELWEKLQSLLAEADAQPVTTVSLTVADNDKTDLPIAELPVARRIVFVGNDLSQQIANVGPGILALRLVAEPGPQTQRNAFGSPRNPWARGVRKIIGYPTYTLPVAGTIPEIEAQSRQREFYFDSAAFACQMGPGDLLVLGPEKYTGERATLGGLFFNKPDETLFFNPNRPKPPERKAAVRIYVLVCTQVNGQ